jgi:serine O-acetyltransferase
MVLFCVAWQKCIEITTGISLPYAAQIGPGLYIGHFGGIIVNHETVIGANCNLSQGVTIGVSGYGSRRGIPVIGDRVYICANAVVAGRITVGHDVVIGGNSLVTDDVPNHVTVVGVPAVVVSQHGSEPYIQGSEDSERESGLGHVASSPNLPAHRRHVVKHARRLSSNEKVSSQRPIRLRG